MAAPDVMSSVLQSLPPRPPTPPRENSRDSQVQTKHFLVCHTIAPRPTIQTPPNNIPSPHTLSGSVISDLSSCGARKKVGFAGLAEYMDAPVYREGNVNYVTHPTPTSLPRASTKPVKSILKVTNDPNSRDSLPAALFDPTASNANLSAMLDSTIQQLAGADRESKLDAYLMLVRALKASNNLPDRVALQEKMSLFMQFMQRDIVSKTSDGTVDSTLVNHALNLLITFLHFPAIASTLSHDFGVFIVDQCIRSFETSSIPKDVVRHLLQVLAYQSFSSKVMTSDRVARLVSSLRKIEEHIKGKSIIMSRVLIYRKLVKQSRQLMAVHSDWLFDLFTDMLSGLKEIRSAAISLGLETAYTIGKEKSLSRKVMEILNLTYEEKTYIEYYEEKLQSMLKENHNSASVPQIWSVVVLLLRCPFDRWEHYSRWLHLIQASFNSPDYPTKIEANFAWSRLVYMYHMDDRSSSSKMITTLTQPLASQLKRRGSGKPAEDLRKVVIGSICNLFYYTFKPNTNITLLDGHWDSTVKPLMKKLSNQKADQMQEDLAQACAILSGLFDCATPRLWKEDHIVETALAKPEELPAIDSKWIRRNAERVFEVVGPILEKNICALAEPASPTLKLWQTLVRTVASAASKEIKVSLDTATFLAHALNLLRKIWNQGPDVEENDPSTGNFLKGVLTYLEVMVVSLGLLPFTEKLLFLDMRNNLVPVSTPSRRPGRPQGPTKAPLHHLFSFLTTIPAHIQDDKTYASFFATAFSVFFAAKNDRARMELALDLLAILPMDAMSPYGPWQLAAENILPWLESGQASQVTNASSSEAPIGHDYRDVVKVLERGLRSTPNLPWQQWQSLFDCQYDRARDETGDAGVAIVLIEPLAKVVMDQCLSADPTNATKLHLLVRCSTEMLSIATQPRDRQAVEAARRRLWGTVVSGARSPSFDTFDNLYKLVNLALERLYQTEGVQEIEDGGFDLLKEVGGFFDRANPQLVMKSIILVQDGLAHWLRDAQAESRRLSADVMDAIKKLWTRICSILASNDLQERLQLDNLETLLCAAFESKHRHIVNTTLSLWNSAFDHVEEIQYPEKLKSTLLALHPFVDIILPGLEPSTIESGAQEPFFADSHDDIDLPNIPSTVCSRKGTPRPSVASNLSASPSAKLSILSKRRLEATPIRKTAKAQQRSSTPRLRHDDSQVQFATIESSPLPNVQAESQVLTEHQQDVRERQKENAALFPEIRSSPDDKNKSGGHHSAKQPSPVQSPELHENSTPRANRVFEDFVTSTPTPRRGSAFAMADHDHDGIDPPSSPPEPRGNPLLAEIQSRSATNNLIDEWQFSSSPISGSPNPSRRAADVDDVARAVSKDEEDVVDDTVLEPKVAEDEIIEEAQASLPKPVTESTMLEDMGAERSILDSAALATTEEVNEKVLCTPSRISPAVATEESPRSDADMFVDALTSPHPPTPASHERKLRSAVTTRRSQSLASQNKDRSFEASDLDEGSMIRLVVELDSANVNPSQYRQVTESPDKAQTKQEATVEEDILDCIVVGDSPEESTPQSHVAKQKSSHSDSPIEMIIPAEESQDIFEGPEPVVPKKKRGRPSKTAGKKRKSQEADEPLSEASQSQTASMKPRGLDRQTRAAKRRRSSIGGTNSQWLEEELLDSQLPGQNTAAEEVMMQPKGAIELHSQDDQELESQIAQESEAQSAEIRDQIEDPVAALADQQLSDQPPAPATHQGKESEGTIKETGVRNIMDRLKVGLDSLRTAKLKRLEVYQVEDMLMDLKRELYEAERRGRE